MKKILWIKFGWSKYYRGAPVDGNFGWLNDQKGKPREGLGHEAYNFSPAADGSYYVYVPPQSGTSAPFNEDPHGWTVICLAKDPKYPGVQVVGWFENATLIGDWLPLPKERNAKSAGNKLPGYDWSYCIKSDRAYIIPPEHRTMPFSDTSVRQGKYSFLSGPNLKQRDKKAEANKRRVLGTLTRLMETLAPVAVFNPTPENLPDYELDETNPLGGFGGTAEQRKKIEKAAERAVIRHYEKLGYTYQDMTKIICGYDFCFTNGTHEIHVEVKGTSGAVEHFYLTRNEYDNGLMLNKRWHLAIVTNALTKKPSVKVYTPKELKQAFGFAPLCYEANLIPKVRN